MKAIIRPETEMKDSGIDTVGKMPLSWNKIRLKNLVKIRTGNEDTQNATPNGRYPFYVRSPIVERCDRYTFEGEAILVAGDGAGAGRIFHLVNGRYAVHQRVYCLSEFQYNAKFIHYYLENLFPHEMNKGSAQSTVPSMRLPMLLNFSLVLPNEDEGLKITDYLDETCSKIDEIIAEAKESIAEYKKLRNSVITHMVLNGIRFYNDWKNIDNVLIGKIPSHWRVGKVKNIASYVSDGAHVSPETDNGVYDFISTVNLQGGKIQFDNCLKTSASSFKQLVKNGCKPQMYDVLISKDGTVGKTTVIDYERDFVIASSLVIIRPRLNLINPFYLEYNLQAHFVQETLQMLMSGAGLKRVSVGKNATLPVVLPPLEEQQEIVEWLDKYLFKYDSLIAEKESLINDLEAYKKSLIYEVVTGKRRVV